MKKCVVSSLGCLLGGNANNGTNAGLAYVNSNNDVSNSNANYGSRTCLKEEETLLKKKGWGTPPLGEKKKNNHGSGRETEGDMQKQSSVE